MKEEKKNASLLAVEMEKAWSKDVSKTERAGHSDGWF